MKFFKGGGRTELLELGERRYKEIFSIALVTSFNVIIFKQIRIIYFRCFFPEFWLSYFSL